MGICRPLGTFDSEAPLLGEPGRCLIVSNRLPVSVRATAGGVRMVPSTGGLATGVRRWHERSDSLWLGWPGDLSGATTTQRETFDHCMQDRRLVPVHLSSDQVDRYYHGFSNRVLWPLFHYLIDRLPTDLSGWDAYRDRKRGLCRGGGPGISKRRHHLGARLPAHAAPGAAARAVAPTRALDSFSTSRSRRLKSFESCRGDGKC